MNRNTYFLLLVFTSIISFGCKKTVILPNITTLPVNEVFANEAQTGGVISSAGNGQVTARGVVWSLSPSPTVALNTKTTDSSGIGTFNSKITGLTPNTKYYVRAYATSSKGTAYGNEVSFSTNDINLKNGLVAYYPFTGNAGDSSGNGNHGAVNGAVLTTDRFGNPNRAYSYNGITNNISIPNSSVYDFESQNAFTLSYWIKPQKISLTLANVIISKQTGAGSTQKGWNSFIEPNAKTNFYIRNGLGQPVSACNYGIISENKWQHIIHYYNKGDAKVFIDGVLAGEQLSQQGVLGNTNVPILIGIASWVASNTTGFNGIVDDLRIYNRVLTQSEITYLTKH
jgi:hypothetical protein